MFHADDADLFVLPHEGCVRIQLRNHPLGPVRSADLSEDQARCLVEHISGDMTPAVAALGLRMTTAAGALVVVDRNEPGYLRIRVWLPEAGLTECGDWTARDAAQISMLRMVLRDTCTDIAAA